MEKDVNYKLLKEIVNKHDPLGLIDSDTPESLGEYDPELKEILKKDISSLDAGELGEMIYKVFVDFFNEELAANKQVYIDIANEFVSLVRK
jgi:hypothetical protein